MIHYFSQHDNVFAVLIERTLTSDEISKLAWLFSDADFSNSPIIEGSFVGPRATMITPYSTNAVEITITMGISDIKRIEVFKRMNYGYEADFDHLLFQMYHNLTQEIFELKDQPLPIENIDDIQNYNALHGLSLSDEEITYLWMLADKLGRPLTDTEVFGFSQINSEHCRHKIFNGKFVIDGHEKEQSLFQMIKSTSKVNPNFLVSAYKDNVAFIMGPKVGYLSPEDPTKNSKYVLKQRETVISLKAETHNFPTTVEPFNGAATGSGGEIRDRMAGGQGSIPLAGTAVYMTSYPRFENEELWKTDIAPRQWLYQSPVQILRKASDGASDFGNKFGQPLISGSCLTFEIQTSTELFAYDKVIMQAGGVGIGMLDQAVKKEIHEGDAIVLLGGDNYRIGLGGAAVSSADTGALSNAIELNAVQRSNPEMQKRVANTIRALVEMDENPILSIHDHGAGGHLNCLTELVEGYGANIHIDDFPIGDPTLSYREILTNESQERMGLVIDPKSLDTIQNIAKRERTPLFVVGKVRNDDMFQVNSSSISDQIMKLHLEDLFGKSPKITMRDNVIEVPLHPMSGLDQLDIYDALIKVMSLEGVACKDWLTNKVDRCVGGKVAKQQCAGALQLPLNNCGVTAIDYNSKHGIAVSMGHHPGIGLISPASASRISILEALTNIIWAPLTNGLKGISLSANWMWPCKNPGEDARLYEAVEACAHFAIELGINIPTGKDSLSMTQKYPNQNVKAPGTVIITAVSQCSDINGVIEPVLNPNEGGIYLINLSNFPLALGGSALSQILNQLGNEAPDAYDTYAIVKTFDAIQYILKNNMVAAGHDVGSGGLIVSLLEMTFGSRGIGATFDLSSIPSDSDVKTLFSENPSLIFQLRKKSEAEALFALKEYNIIPVKIGSVMENETVTIIGNQNTYTFDVNKWRDIWYHKSFLMDSLQTKNNLARIRFENYKNQPLTYHFPKWHSGHITPLTNVSKRVKAGVIREKGSNSERELANALYMAGFDVVDIHTTDIMEGRTDLSEIQFLGAVGGFSHSDVMGSAKGWAAAFMYNEKAKKALKAFFDRPETLSIGICNGCQLYMELGLIYPEQDQHPKMDFNDSGKHESAFTSVEIAPNNSVMLHRFAGTKLGVWISHGEGKFLLPKSNDQYQIVAQYGYSDYPANPNGSDYNAAMLCSHDGRHLVTMPHIERSIYPWNWAYYPSDKLNDAVSPWLMAFVEAKEWLSTHR
ncbi:MAG: phosphoribosylformylglycinamidine synthase [Saprospiraceae bacterium]